MNTHASFRAPLSALLSLVLLVSSIPAIAATGDTISGTGSITEDTPVTESNGSILIEQVGPGSGVKGKWSLIKPDHSQTHMQVPRYELATAPAGGYTLIARPPQGASANVTVIINGIVTSSGTLPQASFRISAGDVVTIKVVYAFTRVGSVSARTEPLGLAFRIKGPNGSEYTGVTPQSFEGVPEGQYTIYFDPIEGCVTPKPKSDRLLSNSRINFTVIFSCENLKNLVQVQDQKKALEFISVTVDGKTVTFEDVAHSAWFATYVHTAIRTGIMSGYRDEGGTATGEYGPEDQVNLAQLAKIAHELAGIDETKVQGEPQNEGAKGTWFAQYFRSAEERNWLVFHNRTVDPARPATRGEVIATLLQALDAPREWPKGEMFTDVSRTTPYADCIETAAAKAVITGYTDALGKPTGEFGPDQPVNRAEMAKILVQAIAAYGKNTPAFRSYKDLP